MAQRSPLPGREPISEPDASATDRLVGSDRVLAVLVELAKHPEGIRLDDMARAIDSPKPTTHRAFAALRRAGLASQDGHGRYVLGDEFLHMAFAHHEARPDHVRVLPILTRLAERHQETTHYAVLDGHSIVYRSKVDPPSGAMKLTSVVGGRNPAHTTAVGKLLLSYRLTSLADVRAWVGESPLVGRTPQSATTVEMLYDELTRTAERGYAVDDQENEPAINCIALPAFLNSPSAPSGAISISAFAYRTPLHELVDDVAAIREIIAGGPAA